VRLVECAGKLVKPLTRARVIDQVFRAEVNESVSIGLVKWEPYALRWSNSAENGRENEALALKYGGTFVAFENGAGAAETATQIQSPSGQIAKSMGV
jgi:hypothetical protein